MRPNETVTLSKQFVKARVTVRLFLVFLESALVQLLQAERAGKVLGMILLRHGRDASSRNRCAAACAQSSSFIVIMGFTEWMTFYLEKVASVKGQLAILQKKYIC